MKLIGRPTVYRLQWAQPRTEAVALFVLGVLWLGTLMLIVQRWCSTYEPFSSNGIVGDVSNGSKLVFGS